MSDQPQEAPAGTSNLLTAVCEVMKEVPTVQRTGTNKHQNYSYASDADLLAALQPAMAKHGLALLPSSMTPTFEPVTSKKGEQMVRVDLVVFWELAHISGESIRVVTCGCGTDNLDKAIYKAQTGARKYAMRLIFASATSDDAERAPAEVPDTMPAPSESKPLATLPPGKDEVPFAEPYVISTDDIRLVLGTVCEVAAGGDVEKTKDLVLRPAGVSDLNQMSAEQVQQVLQACKHQIQNHPVDPRVKELLGAVA